MIDRVHRLRPPAITTGIIPFYVLLRALGFTDKLTLTPDAIFHLDLNRLSFYPLVFTSLLHLVIGAALFAPLCAQFELYNGTVRTGIVLNVAAVIPGVATNLLLTSAHGWLGNVDFCGTSTWILAIAAHLSTTRWSLPSFPVRTTVVTIPAWVLPLLMFVIIAALTPSFAIVHALALLLGYGLGLGYLGFLVEGTTHVVEWIETKLAPGIRVLNKIVVFVDEVEAREARRGVGYARRASVAVDEIALPAESLTHPGP